MSKRNAWHEWWSKNAPERPDGYVYRASDVITALGNSDIEPPAPVIELGTTGWGYVATAQVRAHGFFGKAYDGQDFFYFTNRDGEFRHAYPYEVVDFVSDQFVSVEAIQEVQQIVHDGAMNPERTARLLGQKLLPYVAVDDE